MPYILVTTSIFNRATVEGSTLLRREKKFIIREAIIFILKGSGKGL
jgi:hypothetical protein